MSFIDRVALVFFLLVFEVVFSQGTIKGKIVEGSSKKAIQGVKITIEGQSESAFSDEFGLFKLECSKIGEVVLRLEHRDYQIKRMEFVTIGKSYEIDAGVIGVKNSLIKDIRQEQWLVLSEREITEVDSEVQSITGVLNANKDLFSRTTAYDFGSNFFRRRFLGTEHSTIMLNGVDMKNEFTGRPEWSNWGGLNDALRLQEKYEQMESSSFNLGGLSDGVNMISLASKQSKNFKLSIAAANRSYRSRLMATYSSGMMPSGWAYSVSGSLRFGEEGVRSGTNYAAYSLLMSIDKDFGHGQNVNGTFIAAHTRRGLSSPLTQEVFELKSSSYNSYWGYQDGQKRNSREKVVFEPIVQLNYSNRLNAKTLIHGHFTYQSGKTTSGRLDYSGLTYVSDGLSFKGGGSNPDPTYYQKLPSYYLRDPSKPDFGRAFLAEKEFLEQGQINWSELYEANTMGGMSNSTYVLYDDRIDRRFWSASMGLSKEINRSISIDGAISWRNNFSEHYASMKDLLGGDGYLDVDPFSEEFLQAQSDLRNPDRIVTAGQKFRYNYQLRSNLGICFLRMRYRAKKSDAYLGLSYGINNYQRNGLYENGYHPGSGSFGKSKMISFQIPGIKFGVIYKFTGRHSLIFNSSYLNKTPALKNSFSNIRVSNNLVKDLRSQQLFGLDLRYTWRHRRFNTMVSAYFLEVKNDTKVSFYYADGLSWDRGSESSAFVQESLTGIDKRNVGLEISMEVSALPSFKLKAVAALGRSIYSSDPDLSISSNSFTNGLDLGKTQLSGNVATNGPQNAYSFGFEYSSPQYWWLSASINLFDNSFISVAPIRRSKNFLIDDDGFPIHEIDEQLVEKLLTQKELEPYLNLNIVGGKSWKVQNLYLGFFASINNLANSHYKTGGFEQSRKANYNNLREDHARHSPLFGPKYWFGSGTTFFTSIYLRL